MNSNVQDQRSAIESMGLDQSRRNIEGWLSAPDPSTNYNKAKQQRLESTGLWFLESDTYTRWKTQGNSILWLHGMAGCGKTILSSTIIDDLTTHPHGTVIYFYFDFSDVRKQTFGDMIRSLVRQLFYRCESARSHLELLYSSHEAGRRQPSHQSLCQTFSKMIESADDVCIVLDALDECHTRKGSETEGLLSWIGHLIGSSHQNVHFIATSRSEHDIESKFGDLVSENGVIPLQSNLVHDDIKNYVHTRVKEDARLERWRGRPEVQEEIEKELVQKADGM